jgi:hypothetical protein
VADYTDSEQGQYEMEKAAHEDAVYGDTSPGDVIAAYADGQIVLDDGITTTSYQRACAFLHAALSSAQARVAELERQRDEDTDQINALSTERDQAREELEEARQHGNENIAALHVAEQERDRERAARKEMQRLYEHRGAALLRPCISCGYQPKVVAASNAAQDPT